MKVSTLFLAVLFCLTCRAQFVGSGSRFNWPFCCVACRNSISAAPLQCTPPIEHSHGHSHGASSTPASCYASDDAFLTALAFCIAQRCEEYKMATWEREMYWATSATGSSKVQAKWTYQAALQKIAIPPSITYVRGSPLNKTSLVDYVAWDIQRTQARVLDSVSARGNKYMSVIPAYSL